MKYTDCLFSDIQNLCNAVSDWLIQKSIIQLKPTRQYPVPNVTSCVITAEPVKVWNSPKNSGAKRPGRTHHDAKCPGPKHTVWIVLVRNVRVLYFFAAILV